MAILKVEDVHKSYGELEVLKGVNISMEKGEVLAVIGSSGGGKTTLLRCLTFLERINSGTIEIDGETIVKEELVIPKPTKKVTKKPKSKNKTEEQSEKAGEEASDPEKEVRQEPYKRAVYPDDKQLRLLGLKMGLVFQDFNLFPHMTVLQNLTLAPTKVQNVPLSEAVKQAEEVLAKVGLSEKKDAYPYQLSGGQKQRVAIARALCMNPAILCFDEPTSALDPELTVEVLNVIASLKEQGVTMLIVTHEIEFAKEVADNVIFLDKGIVLEYGNAKELIENPKTDRAKEFLSKIKK